MERVVVVTRDSKYNCVGVCEHFPDKIVGSANCRGCRYHERHSRENVTVICSWEPEGYVSDMAEFQKIFKKEK